MKNNKRALVLGILFGVSLAAVAYLYLGVGIALAFGGDGLLAYACYAFAGLAVTTIVTSAFAIKNVVVARVGLTVSVVCSAFAHIYSLIKFVLLDLLEATSLWLYGIFFVSLLLGVLAMTFAYKAKKQPKAVEPAEPAAQ